MFSQIARRGKNKVRSWIFGGPRKSLPCLPSQFHAKSHQGEPNTPQEEVDSSSAQQIGGRLETFPTIPRPSTGRLDDPIPMLHFVDGNYKTHFKWDTREQDQVAAKVGLTEKHKVFPSFADLCLPECGPFERQPGPTLGSVHNTVVYAVRPPTSVKEFKQVLALKVIRCENKKRVQALQEVKNMVLVEHWHIVSYIASYEQFYVGKERRTRVVDGIKTQTEKEVVKEYNLGIAIYPAGECDLVKYMELAMEYYPDDERLNFMYNFFGCLSQAVSYLHNRRIRLKHKDIKPGNIIIDSFNQPLLTDFGISKHYIKGEVSKSDGYTSKTVKYACPQSTDEKERDYRSDVYSLGCVFLEMVTVILGKKLSELETFRGAEDDKPAYCKTLPKVYEWLQELGNGAQRVENPPVPVSVLVPVLGNIKTMLSKELRPRPWADQLWPFFTDLYIFDDKGRIQSRPMPCPPCEKQNTITLKQGNPERRDTTLSSGKNSDNRISSDILTEKIAEPQNGPQNIFTPG
jgi:serine/threonine protein kinase